MKTQEFTTSGEPPKRPVSSRQLAANRANAPKSRGPKTPEGKAAVRFNALTHGLTAAMVVIPGEELDHYAQRRLLYHEILMPANLIEVEIVDHICANRWRRNRAVVTESALVHSEICRIEDDLSTQFASLSESVKTALAIRSLADTSRALQLLDRYETRLANSIDRDLRQLRELRRTPPPAPVSQPPGPPSAPELLDPPELPPYQELEVVETQPFACERVKPAAPKLPNNPIPEIEHPHLAQAIMRAGSSLSATHAASFGEL